MSEPVSLPAAGTEFADNLINFVGPLADAIMPLVGPKLGYALPWLVTGLVAAIPVCLALWPVLYKLAEAIPGTLDTWLLDRVGALIERLSKWILRKDVKLVPKGDLEVKTVEEVTAGLTQEEIEAAKEEAGL